MRNRVVALLLVCAFSVSVVGCGRDDEGFTSEASVSSEARESSDSDKSSIDAWDGQSKPSESVEESKEASESSSASESEEITPSSSESSASSEASGVEPTEESYAESSSSEEGIDSSEDYSTNEIGRIVESFSEGNKDLKMIPEEDLVHVVIPEMNKGFEESLYNSAAYKVEGDVAINENIDFGIRVDSDDIRKLITLIYEGTGCTSHTISDEYLALFDYDSCDYSAKMTLNTGEVYYLRLLNNTCYALDDNY